MELPAGIKLEELGTDDVVVSPPALHDLVVRALCAVGVSPEHAQTTADVLVEADLRGIESHGVARLPAYYIQRVRAGTVNTRPRIATVAQTASTALVDGDRGLGFAVGHRAMEMAMAKAEQTGAGLVSVRNSTHFGPAFYYAMLALLRDMIGISMTTGGNLVVPPGGRRRSCGANALCIAAPVRNAPPFVLDMATSVVAGGKLEVASRRQQPVPEGWILDADGRPSTQFEDYFLGGGLLPLGGAPTTGGHKGFGLALAVDVLCGLLSGGGASVNLESGANHFFGALGIGAFVDPSTFHDLMERMLKGLKTAPRADGVEAITYAGEPEEALARKRRASGIPLHWSVAVSLRLMAHELGIEYGLEEHRREASCGEALR